MNTSRIFNDSIKNKNLYIFLANFTKKKFGEIHIFSNLKSCLFLNKVINSVGKERECFCQKLV